MTRLALVLLAAMALGRASRAEPRAPLGERELRFWMETMVVDHGYSAAEIQAATGLPVGEVPELLARLGLADRGVTPGVPGGGEVRVRPYPGGRHPRLGFFDGAVQPQRETKLSVFAPWAGGGYVVVDVPEAIWSHRGLEYLAHTHIPTLWERRGIPLEPREWSRRADGSWSTVRTLPDGVAFGVRARPVGDGVRFRWWVRNGSDQVLREVRAQVCVMLGRATGFEAQRSDGKFLEAPFASASDGTGRRWILTAWEGLHRVWENPPVPCIHADPRLDDLPPGVERSAWGGLWFYEGDDPFGARAARLASLREFVAEDSSRFRPLDAVPDKLVVLTFDDSVASHATVVAPLLRRHGFGATFFITEGFSFRTNKTDYMTWEQIAALHRDGFEIGNHTATHLPVAADTLGRLRQEVESIAARCEAHGIPRPVSFAYPGNAIHPGALPLLRDLGTQFARRGGQPEREYREGLGVLYDPAEDHPLLIPTAGDARPDWTLKDLERAVSGAERGRIAVLQFHGVPDREHPWVHTSVERFEEYLEWLAANGYRCIALRDLGRFVDPLDAPADPWG